MHDKTTREIIAAIQSLEKLGCPLIGMSYVNRKGAKSERDIQINVHRPNGGNPLPYGKRISKSLIEHKGNTYVQAIDRNRSKFLRNEAKQKGETLSLADADRLSTRAFRVDRIQELRYGK
jgi:hypothetical protein